MINKEKYKRLTERRGSLVIDKCGNCLNVSNPGGCTAETCRKIVQNRLAELEDKIENGTLFELPCKVGDKVYTLDNAGDIYESEIKCLIYATSHIAFDETAIGTSIFLTKAEAEARQKELNEENKQ